MKAKGEYSDSQIWPVVADVTGDGLWDLIVCSATETNVLVNTGTKDNPQFAKCGSVGADVPGGLSVDLDMNSTAKLAEMTLDVAPVGALSATTNGTTLLVSDTEGRIWLYEGTEATEETEGTEATDSLQNNVSAASLQSKASAASLQNNVSAASLQSKASAAAGLSSDSSGDASLKSLLSLAFL